MKKASVFVTLAADIAAIVFVIICIVNAVNTIGGTEIEPILNGYSAQYYGSIWHHILLGVMGVSYLLLFIGYIISTDGAKRVLMIISVCLWPVAIGAVVLMQVINGRVDSTAAGIIMVIPVIMNIVMFVIDSSCRPKFIFWFVSMICVAGGFYIVAALLVFIIAFIILKLTTPIGRSWTIIGPDGAVYKVFED